jgi:hypothetical protein
MELSSHIRETEGAGKTDYAQISVSISLNALHLLRVHFINIEKNPYL